MNFDLKPGDVALMGIPLDRHSSFLQGPAFAPGRIREVLHNGAANLTSETGVDLGTAENWKDTGDVDVFEEFGAAPIEKIKQATIDRIKAGAKVLSLGGDHSVAFPLIDAHAKCYDGLNVLHIDAHPDLYENQLDNPYAHGSPFARIMETGRVKRLVQVGIRTLNKHQREQAEKYGVEIVDMMSWRQDMEFAFDGPVYMSLDLDGLDPAFAPGVSHHEPGGLSTREVLSIIQRFKGDLVGADIVELNPHRDVNDVTAMVAAKLLKEIAGRLLQSS